MGFLMGLECIVIEFVNIDISGSNPEARYCDRGLYTSRNLERLDHLMTRNLATDVLAVFVYKDEVCV
jgi:hypothetical protein